jgi:hypothetical protein
MANEQNKVTGEWLKNTELKTTPEIMQFMKEFFSYASGADIWKTGGDSGGTNESEAAYKSVKDFNYNKFVNDILGKLQPTDISKEIQGLDAIPENLMREYRDVLLPEFKETGLNQIMASLAGRGFHGSGTENAVERGITGLNREALTNYLQARTGVGQQKVQLEAGNKMDFGNQYRNFLVQLMSGKTDWLKNRAGLAQGVDTLSMQRKEQENQLNPLMALAAQMASAFDPYNMSVLYQQLPFFDKEKSAFNSTKKLTAGTPMPTGFPSASSWT